MTSPELLRLTFGSAEGYEASDKAAAFTELAAWMKEHAGIDLVRTTAKTYRELAVSVREGKSDIAWLPPVVYAWLAESVTPLGSIVREGSAEYATALVVLDTSPVRELADLKGKRIGWVDPWSAAGFVVPRIELAAAGIDPTEVFASETFYGTHRDVMRALGRGDCDVAATFARKRADGDDKKVDGGWGELTKSGKIVRVVAIAGSIPPDVLAVRRNLAPTSFERALEALRKASADEEGRKHLRAIFGGDQLREGVEPGHEALRRAYERGVADGLFD